MIYCLSRLASYAIPNDVISHYLKLYRYIGRNDEFLNMLDLDYETFVAQTIREDSFFINELLKLSLKEDRIKSLILKNAKPQTHDEKVLTRIKEAMIKMHENIDSFELIANEIVSLHQFIYKDIAKPEDLSFDRLKKADEKVKSLLDSKTVSKRSELEALVIKYQEGIDKHGFEKGFVAAAFYLDFVSLHPFMKYNETISYLILYLLLLNSDYRCFHVVSFFEKLAAHRIAFKEILEESLKNHKEGVSSPIPLHRFLLQITLEAYQEMHGVIKIYTFDHQFNKTDYLENSVNRLPEVFTKEDLRHLHPTVSDSTINRTLNRLKDEGKISPLGKGRSAKWMKHHSKPKKPNLEQMKLKF
jgi:hypothetical protein